MIEFRKYHIKALAEEYHRRCDEFDATVAVGGVPRTEEHQKAMSRNAKAVFHELLRRVPHVGYENLRHAIRIAAHRTG